jgi:F-type H+-transporting ATPase subunit epsilon
MENKIHLIINGIDMVTLDTYVNYVLLPLEDGEYGVLAGHAPMVALITEGIIKYRIDDTEDYLTVSDGIASIMDNTITILVRSAELVEQIDYERAKDAEARARRMLQLKQEEHDHKRYEAALRRSLQRQKLYKLKH